MRSMPRSTRFEGPIRRYLAMLAVSLLIGVSLFAVPRENLRRTLEVQYEVVRGAPSDPAAHNDLANLLVLAGRDAEAEASYLRAIDLAPGAREPRFNIALLYQQGGRVEEARTSFEELVASDPSDAWSYYQLGVLYDRDELRAKAIEHYARAFALDPSLTFARINPHIIDNELSTEALLLSAQYSEAPGELVPRLYHDRKRIQDWLLEGEEVLPVEQDSRPREGLSSGTQIRPLGEAEEEFEGEAEEARVPVQRVIRNEDLESGVATGQVQSGRFGRGGGASGRGAKSVRRPERTTEKRSTAKRPASGRSSNGNDTRSGRAKPVPGGGTTGGRPFQPGRPSTGRLELELQPPEPKQQYARLETRRTNGV